MKNIILLFALSGIQSLFSQNLNSPKPFINSIGNSEIEVTPDQIVISIWLTDKNTSKTASSIQDQEQFLIKTVQNLKLDSKKLILRESNSQYSNIGIWKKEVIATKNYELEVQNTKQLGFIYDELKKINIQNAYISEIKYSKKDSIMKVLRIKAIKDAQNKAEYLTKAINYQIDMPLEIEDRGENTEPILYRGFANRADSSMYKTENDSFEPALNTPDIKSIRFSSSIYVKFGIK